MSVYVFNEWLELYVLNITDNQKFEVTLLSFTSLSICTYLSLYFLSSSLSNNEERMTRCTHGVPLGCRLSCRALIQLYNGLHYSRFCTKFIACGKSRDKAHELASLIWLAVINNLEENEHTFPLLKRLALEGDVSRSSTNFILLFFTHDADRWDFRVRFTFGAKSIHWTSLIWNHICIP